MRKLREKLDRERVRKWIEKVERVSETKKLEWENGETK